MEREKERERGQSQRVSGLVCTGVTQALHKRKAEQAREKGKSGPTPLWGWTV